jgi:hypothetical protein
MFISGYDSKEFNSESFRASFQKSTIVQKQRLSEITKLKEEYASTIDELRQRSSVVESMVSTEAYYKDLYFNELMKVRGLVEKEQYDKVKEVLDTLTSFKEDMAPGRVSRPAEHEEQRGSEARQGAEPQKK